MKQSLALAALAPLAAAFAPPASRRAASALRSSVAEDTATVTMKRVPVFDEVCETTGVTLTRFMDEVAGLNPEARELTVLFDAVGTACKAIGNMVKRSQLPSSETLGLQGDTNSMGEDQKKLDIITNDVLKRALRFTGRLGVLASEEEDAPVDLAGGSKEMIVDRGERYVAVFDPLDGSSNVDAGIPTGTIIGVYEYDDTCPPDLGEDEQCLRSTLQRGTNLVAAAYCLYSSSTFLTLTLGNGAYMFTLDEAIGEFVLSKPDLKCPEDSKIYSLNDANQGSWDAPLRKTVDSWRDGTSRNGKAFTSRYIGSMVGDVHRTLLYGGVFGYPADASSPNGKLRLVYEGAPMSFIVEQAGGLATTGRERVMDMMPQEVHQRVPIVMGSRNQVQEVIDAYAAEE